MQILGLAVSLFSQRGFAALQPKDRAGGRHLGSDGFRHLLPSRSSNARFSITKPAPVRPSIRAKLSAMPCNEKRMTVAVFEGLAFQALERHECDTEFHRLLLMPPWSDTNSQRCSGKGTCATLRVLGGYIRERQREGAMIDRAGSWCAPSSHGHSPFAKQQPLGSENDRCCRFPIRSGGQFTEILLNGVLNSQLAKQSNAGEMERGWRTVVPQQQIKR